jgi:two-component system chemotaxis response regulator CheY
MPDTEAGSRARFAIFAQANPGYPRTITSDAGSTQERQGAAQLLASPYEVLVVDDSPFYRRLVEQLLSSGPYSLLFAKNGEEAVKLFHEREPCIVVSDWVMPDLTGPELCERIRANANGAYTYVILMTSKAERANVVQGLQAGADDYLTKPFDSAEMLARIGVGRRIIDLNRELVAKSQRLEEAARTDPLTGLPNRRAIEEWASKQLRGAARHGFSYWVIVGDLDCFKSINDTFGHHAGDAVLRQFADILKKNTRASDICGRLGGDEFLMVLTYVSAGYIEATVNKFRQQLAELSFPFQGKSVNVTASFGVAGFYGKDSGEFSDLVREADRMLYEAKRSGRNLVKVSQRIR